MRSVALITLLLLVVGMAPVAYADETESSSEDLSVFHDKGYLVAQSEDGKTKYWLDGRIMLDYGEISSDNNLPSGWETRRARLGVKTIFDGKWAGEFDMDIADNEIEIKDFWMAYIGAENTIVKVGNQKPPGSMEEVTTSRWLTFMERSIANGFASGRRIGVSYTKYGEKFFFSGGYFGQEPGTGEEEGEDEATGIAARVAFAPVVGDGKVFHIGATYGSYEPEAGEEDRVRFRARELHLMDRMLNTGKVEFVDDYQLMGFELAGQNGPWSFQSEYLTADLSRFAGEPDASYSGYYAFVSYFPFGAQRTYSTSSGEFGAIHPEGDKGALELALRFSNIDLNDFGAGVEGGSADNITLGLNWYANDNLRVMFNYIMQDNDEFADGDGDFIGNDDLDIIAMRFQLLF